MVTIAVFGGNGYAGGTIVAEALRRGHEVTVISRSATGVEGAAVRRGSIGDAGLVGEVAADADVLVSAVPGRILPAALPALITAGIRHGARLAVVGGAGSLLVAEGGPRLVDTPDFPEEWKPEALASAEALAGLRAAPAELDWFYLSPAALFGAFAPGETTGRYRVGGELLLTAPDGGPGEISGTDYALAFVDEIDHRRHNRSRFTVAH